MDISQYITDKNLETEGSWVPVDPTTRLKIARANNKNYLNALQRQIKENGYAHAARNGKMPPEAMESFVTRAVAETIIVGWEGLTENGKPLKYSADEAERQLKDKPDFFCLRGFSL